MCFFFFKQKTAYEMRISDWSSDVCSSDLLSGDKVYGELFDLTDEAEMGHVQLSRDADLLVVAPASADLLAKMAQGRADDLASTVLLRSEEHTSELQSLMRTSYAVFCLKKKDDKTVQTDKLQHQPHQ